MADEKIVYSVAPGLHYIFRRSSPSNLIFTILHTPSNLPILNLVGVKNQRDFVALADQVFSEGDWRVDADDVDLDHLKRLVAQFQRCLEEGIPYHYSPISVKKECLK